MKIQYLVPVISLTVFEAQADNSPVDAAIGGGIGGAAGAAIGNEIGGHDGAITGGALGGGIGTAIAADDKELKSRKHGEIRHRVYEEDDYHDVEFEPFQPQSSPTIPPGHLPPLGECRIWYPGTPPGHQPPPGSCRELRHHVPRGAWLVRG